MDLHFRGEVTNMGKPKNKARGARGKKKKGPSQADRADKHALYQRSVQTPDADIEFFTQVYEARHGKTPLIMREDFCGTAYLSTKWVQSHENRKAIGVDLDGPTLEWGRVNNLEPAGEVVSNRIELFEGNVLDDLGAEPADVTCALNFSYCVFHDRPTLLRYFKRAYEDLAKGGIFICELYGGTEAIIEYEEDREVAGFTYQWEQASFNPIDHHTVCHIHFEFSDGSKIKKAFTYEWRLWTVPELRELLAEAGFEDVTVYWEAVDEDGDGTGEFEPTECEENQESWLVYLSAAKP